MVGGIADVVDIRGDPGIRASDAHAAHRVHVGSHVIHSVGVVV
jgi:hypothetical protein